MDLCILKALKGLHIRLFLRKSIQIDFIDISLNRRLCTWSESAGYRTSENRIIVTYTENKLQQFTCAEEI